MVQKIRGISNHWYVSKREQKELWKTEGPLERNMLAYMLTHDDEIKALKRNKNGVRVFFSYFSIQFGLMQFTLEELYMLQKDIDDFHETCRQQKEAVFILILGVLNHWITVVIHKESPLNGQKSGQNKPPKLYILNSDNKLFYFAVFSQI